MRTSYLIFLIFELFCCYGTSICFSKLTVLTSPVGHGNNSYGGHYAVTRSIVEGLKKVGANFNYNPSRIEELGDVVFVPGGIQALEQAVQLRRQGRIKKLIAGPNLVMRTHEYNHLIVSPEVDVYVSPSAWPMQGLIQDDQSLEGRSQIWYAGVDTNFWSPMEDQKKDLKRVLVYWKTESEFFCESIEKKLRKYGFSPKRIKYGNYNAAQFKKELSKCSFAVFISKSESQGLALAEAWAMDVPTLVWDPQEPLDTAGKLWENVSSCPYMNMCVGSSWKTIEEFEALLAPSKEVVMNCSPRSWVLRNMSDDVSARLLLSIINNEPNTVLSLVLD